MAIWDESLETKEVEFVNGSGEKKCIEVETFTWEKLDMVDAVKAAFGITKEYAVH